MKTQIRIHVLRAMLSLLCFLPPAVFAQGTAFTYQGSLNDGSGKASGLYDLRFNIYDANTAGSIIAGPRTNASTGITNGLFTVTLDFGPGVFPGAPRWLEISVRTNGAVPFITLAPRQALTAVPYAITASNLTGTLPASQLSGTLAPAQLSGSYNGSVSFINPGNVFNGSYLGDGSALTGVNAATLAGLGPNAFWKLSGNSNILDGFNYIGTSDSNSLELRVNNYRALRIDPDPRGFFAPNIVGGYGGNSAQQPGSGGNAIVGGGAPGIPNIIQTNSAGNFIGAGSGNGIGTSILDTVIAGGYGNTALSSDSVISGGSGNNIQTNASYSIIAGGTGNSVSPNAVYSVIGGGQNNFVNTSWGVIAGGYFNTNNSLVGFIGSGDYNIANGNYSAIGGGVYNEAGGVGSFIGGGGYDGFNPLGNRADANASAIAGGNGNTISNNADGSFIGAGQKNNIGLGAYDSVISGGVQNTIGNNSFYSILNGGSYNLIRSNAAYSIIGGGTRNTNFASEGIIGGGEQNFIGDSSFDAVIAGGVANKIGTNAFYATISGGSGNIMGDNATYSTIGGGYANTVSNIYSVIPGGYGNTVLGSYSFAAGRQAKATNFGTFVWADSQGLDFNSTAPNQFLIRAAGGVGLNKNNPATALDVVGTVTAYAFNATGLGFSGPGASLTGLNASQLTTGTLPSSALSGTYSSVVALNNPGNSYSGSGASLVSLNGSQVTSGTVADARLSTNVALLNRSPQTFTGQNNFSGNITLTDPTKTITFPATSGANAPMITMFASGSANADRMVIAHSSSFLTWGLQYQDLTDKFNFLSGGTAILTVDLGGGHVGVRNSSPSDLFNVVDAHCDGNTWINSSDRNLKENFTAIDPEQILCKVLALPVTEWNYKNKTARHLGPVAQDFSAQFNLGADDKSIATIDESGVALAAIQGLNKKLEQQSVELKEKDQRIAALEQAVTELREMVRGTRVERRASK